MNWLDLQKMAEKVVEQHPDAEQDSMDDRLLLRIPEPKKHNGWRVRLFGNRGPLAVILSGTRGKLNVHVSSRRILNYLDGMVILSEEWTTHTS